MYFSSINFASVLQLFGDTVVGIEDFNVAITKVIGVAVDKAVINAKPCKVLDSVSGMNVGLHAIFCDKEMTAASHDRVIGIVKQIICIEKQNIGRRQMIGKKVALQIDWCLNIEAIVFKIDQADPFMKGKNHALIKGIVIRCQCIGLLKKLLRFQIGMMSQKLIGKASQTDMLRTICNRRAVIDSAVLFFALKTPGKSAMIFSFFVPAYTCKSIPCAYAYKYYDVE